MANIDEALPPQQDRRPLITAMREDSPQMLQLKSPSMQLERSLHITTRVAHQDTTSRNKQKHHSRRKSPTTTREEPP